MVNLWFWEFLPTYYHICNVGIECQKAMKFNSEQLCEALYNTWKLPAIPYCEWVYNTWVLFPGKEVAVQIFQAKACHILKSGMTFLFLLHGEQCCNSHCSELAVQQKNIYCVPVAGVHKSRQRRDHVWWDTLSPVVVSVQPQLGGGGSQTWTHCELPRLNEEKNWGTRSLW